VDDGLPVFFEDGNLLQVLKFKINGDSLKSGPKLRPSTVEGLANLRLNGSTAQPLVVLL
jgi:hypothetical protein